MRYTPGTDELPALTAESIAAWHKIEEQRRKRDKEYQRKRKARIAKETRR